MRPGAGAALAGPGRRSGEAVRVALIAAGAVALAAAVTRWASPLVLVGAGLAAAALALAARFARRHGSLAAWITLAGKVQQVADGRLQRRKAGHDLVEHVNATTIVVDSPPQEAENRQGVNHIADGAGLDQHRNPEHTRHERRRQCCNVQHLREDAIYGLAPASEKQNGGTAECNPRQDGHPQHPKAKNLNTVDGLSLR